MNSSAQIHYFETLSFHWLVVVAIISRNIGLGFLVDNRQQPSPLLDNIDIWPARN